MDGTTTDHHHINTYVCDCDDFESPSHQSCWDTWPCSHVNDMIVHEERFASHNMSCDVPYNAWIQQYPSKGTEPFLLPNLFFKEKFVGELSLLFDDKNIVELLHLYWQKQYIDLLELLTQQNAFYVFEIECCDYHAEIKKHIFNVIRIMASDDQYVIHLDNDTYGVIVLITKRYYDPQCSIFRFHCENLHDFDLEAKISKYIL